MYVSKIFILEIVIIILSIILFFCLGSIILSIIFFLFLSVVVLYKPAILTLNFLTKKTNWYKLKVGDGSKFLNKSDFDIDICNLGSTSAKYSFDYRNAGMKGENWALESQTLSYDFRVLKNYSSYLKEGAFVLIPLCPFSGCVTDYDNDNINHKYYSFLNPVFILNYSKSTKEKVSKFIDSPFQCFPIISLIRIIKDIKEVDSRIMDKDQLEIDATQFITNRKIQFGIDDLDGPVSLQTLESIKFNRNVLSEMIYFCTERKLKPIIILPPASKALTSKLSETFRCSYIYSLIKGINNESVRFLDYFEDNRFKNNDMYFSSFYMNEKGRTVFTQAFLNDLGKLV